LSNRRSSPIPAAGAALAAVARRARSISDTSAARRLTRASLASPVDDEHFSAMDRVASGMEPQLRRVEPKPAVGKPGKTFREHAYDVAMAVMAPLAALVERTSLVPTTPFMRSEDFLWTRPLEANWRDIRDELESVLVYRDDLPAFHEINADVTDIANNDWKSFFFYGMGMRAEANCRRCPRTAALIDAVPGVTTAFFSILMPGARLPPHTGAWKGFLRYHLGLMVPEPPEKCGIVVGGEQAHWAEGRSLVFDDTYLHHVWNDTSETRVVLFMDVVRPCRFPGSLVNRAVIKATAMSPFIRSMNKRHEAWERRFEGKHAQK
jgi:beta-hydroxylase